MVFNRSTPMESRHASHAQRGLTLVECMVALGVAAVAAAAAAPDLGRLIDAHRFAGIATQLAADLQLARHEAIVRNRSVRFSLDATAGCYVIHTGAAGACNCAAGDAPAVCSADTLAVRTVRWSAPDRVALETNAASIVFDPRHGTATPAATLRVVGADGRAVHHVVNVMGRVRSCAGQGRVPGYRAC
jgi:type IV fimbrial biogenesis protein FimT